MIPHLARAFLNVRKARPKRTHNQCRTQRNASPWGPALRMETACVAAVYSAGAGIVAAVEAGIVAAADSGVAVIDVVFGVAAVAVDAAATVGVAAAVAAVVAVVAVVILSVVAAGCC